MKMFLAVLAVILLPLATDITVRAEEVISQPVWSVGDWWELNGIRQTVIGQRGDRYEIIPTWAGTGADPAAPQQRLDPMSEGSAGTGPNLAAASKNRLYMMSNGWVAESVDRDGKVTRFTEDTKYEWVHFPLSVGSRWTFVVLGKDRTSSSNRYDYNCAAARWKDLEFSAKLVRTLRIECKSSIRGSPGSGWFHTAWYAPEAKRLVRLRSQYAGGWTIEISAWSVRP
jgi:hypothetical protein